MPTVNIKDITESKIVRLVDLSEDSINKIAEAVVQKIANNPTVPQHIESVGEDGSALKHGHWIDGNGKPVSWDDMNIGCPSDSCYCSECGDWLTASDEYPAKGYYCPNCGAKMDEVEE